VGVTVLNQIGTGNKALFSSVHIKLPLQLVALRVFRLIGCDSWKTYFL